jgi:hypothetical protein
MTLTAADLVLALRVKVHAAGYLLRLRGIEATAEEAREAITTHHLSTAIVPGTKPPLTFSAAYAHIFQRDLEGRPVRKGRRG